MDSRWVGVPGVVALLCALVSGCGSDSAKIADSDAASLHRQVEEIRAAAKDGKNDAAQAGIADLRTSIRQLAASGRLDPNDGLVLLAQADRLAEQIDARPTPTPTPTPVIVHVPAPEPKHKKDEDGPGKGKEHDK